MENHIKVLNEALNMFRSEEKYFDVTLSSSIDNESIRAHSLILAAGSVYLREQFISLAQLGKPLAVSLHMSSDNIRYLVKYCYNRRVEINNDNVEELLAIASLLNWEEIEKFLICEISTSNCLHIMTFAQENEHQELLQQAELYLFEHFTLISSTEYFLQLSPEKLLNILAKIRQTSCEEQVFNSVMKWVEHDNGQRKQFLPKLLPHIHVERLGVEFVWNQLDIIRLSQEALEQAQKMLKEEQKAVSSTNPTERSTMAKKNMDKIENKFSTVEKAKMDKIEKMSMLFVIGLNQQEKDEARALLQAVQIDSYDAEQNRCETFDVLEVQQFGFGAVCVNQDIILVGGTVNQKATRCVVRMSHSSEDQADEKDQYFNRIDETYMMTGRAHAAVVVADNNVYAIGGADCRNEDLHTVERLNLSSGKWEYVASLNEARRNAGVTVLEGCLYVVGGIFQDKSLCTVERYDAKLNKWFKCKSMTTERRDLGVATFKGCIYVAGGRDYNLDCLSSVERYDASRDEWSKVCALQKPRAGLSCIVYEDKLYAIGGRFEGSIETYNHDLDEWKVDAYMCDFYSTCIALTSS